MGSNSPRGRGHARGTAVKAVAAAFALVVSGSSGYAAAAADYERIVNGTFGSGTTAPWWNGAGTTGKVVDGEFCNTVTGGTTNPWDALIGQNGVPYEAGQSYTLTFDARATTAQQVSAVAGEGVSPYRQIAKGDFAVTTARQTFTFDFTSTLDFPDAGNGQLTFHLGGQPFDNTICVDNVSLIGGVLPPGGIPGAPTKKVQVNQVAYVPGLPKHATLVTDATAPQAWSLRNSAGAEVATGLSTPMGADAGSGDAVHVIDFSSYDTEGTRYTLTVGTETSFPFDISVDQIKKLRYDSLAFFYHQRSGTPIEARYAGEAYARPAGHVNVAPNQGDNNVGCRADLNCGYTLDVRGGWYDAGDHGKYVVNGGISAWQVLDTYERAVAFGDAAALGDGSLEIPENANGVPDILDEARWEVEFLLKMQAPNGMAHHKIHDAAWTGLPTLPHLDAQPRRLSAVSTAATLNLAAVAAQAARIWKRFDPAFAATALTASEKAYAAAKANPDVLADPNDGSGGGAYNDDKVEDEFYWAAAELYTTTGQNAYRADVTGSPLYKGKSFNARGFDWGSTGALGDITLAVLPNGLPAADIAEIKSAVAATADGHLAQMATQAYPAPYKTTDGTYEWGSNGLVANNGVVLALAHDFTGQAKYREGVYEALHYLLGRNPMSYSYVTGYGDQPVRNVHHRHWANQIDASLPIAPRGVLSGGPNSGLQDPIAARLLQGCKPQKCFIDHIEAYSLNEVTVNWNSALVWVANWAAEKSDVDTTAPTAPGRPTATATTSTSVALKWQASTDPESGVRGYDVLRVDGTSTTVVASSSTTSATVSGLKPATAYTFVVVAKNGVGLRSERSPEIQVTTKSPGCKVEYRSNKWTSGQTVNVTVTNTGTESWSDWKLQFGFPGSQQISHGWSATWTQSGADVTAVSTSWNGALEPGRSAWSGFVASATDADGDPTSFTVNGEVCSS